MTNIEILGAVGSLASIVGLVAFKGDIRNWLKGLFELKSLDGYLSSLNLRSQCKIAIVDDELTDFPVNYLLNAGYEVDTYSSIEMSEFKKLLCYDIVFLDVQGVVKSDPDHGGAKLIKLLVKERPLQPIVAVSSGQFKASLTEFFELSYDRINKPVEEVAITTVIEEICRETFYYEKISSGVEELITCSKVKNEKKLLKGVLDYLKGKQSESDFEEFIHKNTSYKFSSKIIDKCKQLKDRVDND
ncbi:response regulator [Vibrio parahaemolyticus]|nr:response regulator [Vibrio parahaemolyticus]EGR1961515.1 response regulator [Vibrio parahaemolyticus]EGR1969956.1 response regulator [Vibrio parahaemolyticus]